MSERESGFGSFVLGVAAGVVLGLLFAPEPGEDFRGKLGRRLRTLRDLAGEKAGELGELVGDAAVVGGRARRLTRGRRRPRATPEEGDEPVE